MKTTYCDLLLTFLCVCLYDHVLVTVANLTTGQLLCGGLFSGDALSNWFSAVALSHALVENPAQKEQLLRVLLATNVGSPPISLLHQCTMLLQQVGLLQLDQSADS